MLAAPWKQLPDQKKGINKTQVYVQAPISEEIPNIEAALRYLRNLPVRPLPLRRVSQSGLTVVLEASCNPKIVFGRMAPTGNEANDIAEIIYVLESIGIDSKLIG
jgi:hypothetical protein